MRFLRSARLPLLLSILAAGVLFARGGIVQEPERFPHQKHAGMFPLCTTCHAGVLEPGAPPWPEPASCASCHDGVVKPRITWQRPTTPRGSNLRFTHESHNVAAMARDTVHRGLMGECSACHTRVGEPRMAVRHASARRCIACHGYTAAHVDLPNEACAKCHVPLTRAAGLTTQDIADFPRPGSHDDPGFRLGGHGKLARVESGTGQVGIAASCATCHARNLCISCHVNAAESPVISALELDSRSPVFAISQPVPESHQAPDFLRNHGRLAEARTATCSTCHTRESCMTCHVEGTPRAVAALAAAGPDRAIGAQLVRRPPPSHTREFMLDRHAGEANARPRTCETCHTRTTCLTCHRPDVDRQPRYHAANFLTRHPSAAYAREASCSDCHNTAQFCQDCHQQSGLGATRRIGIAGYHDAFRGFSLGHGQAARQSLESCASCHAERDCTACHSAVSGGFRFNPHGPGFNAARMRAKNPSMCSACHGRAIPDGS